MDQAIIHSIAVFQGVRSYNGFIFKSDEHIGRLYRSAENVGMQVPLTKDELKKVCKEFIERKPAERCPLQDHCYTRILLFLV